MYADGRGVPQDDAEAAKWYRLAAEQGIGAAQYNLAVMYATGRGVRQDYVQAHKWVDLAASRATGDDEEKYAEACGRIATRMTDQQIAEAQRLAGEWKPKTWDELKDQ